LSSLSCVNKATGKLASVTARLTSAHFERLKSLLTFSAFAFGTSELADMLCLKLAGIPLLPEQEDALMLILNSRPDNDRLSKAIRRAEDARWDTQWMQACDLENNFNAEFLATQKRMRQVHSSNPNRFATAVRQTSLLRAAFLIGVEEQVKGFFKGLFSQHNQKH
jgi:hypothetical protein